MIDCLTNPEMMYFISLLTQPDVVAMYLDGTQIDIGPTVWYWFDTLQMWVHGDPNSCGATGNVV